MATIRDLPSFQRRPWSPAGRMERGSEAFGIDTDNVSDARHGAIGQQADDSLDTHNDESPESPYPKPLSPRSRDGNHPQSTTHSMSQHTSNSRRGSRRGENDSSFTQNYNPSTPAQTRGQLHHAEAYNMPNHNYNDGNDPYTWSPRQEYKDHDISAVALELDGSPISTPSSRPKQWSVQSPDYMSIRPDITPTHSTNSRPGPQPSVVDRRQTTFRTSDDDTKAQEILLRDKISKLDRRSSTRKFFMMKSKRTTFSEREIYRALMAVVSGHERAGPGVVEVLLAMFIKEGGNINLVPQQKGLLTKKREERSGILEIAASSADVEVVQLLCAHSDKESKNKSLDISLHGRKTSGGRNYNRIEQMIAILVREGADGVNNISDATARGDENLLTILLEGNANIASLSDALPIAVATEDSFLRRKLAMLLLDKGADVNNKNGEAILQAVKVFDLHLLDKFLESRPHAQSLDRAFTVALGYANSDHRFKACQRLIYAGATGEVVNQGLAIAVTTEYQNIDFLGMILRGATVDFEDGHALCLAISSNYQEHVKLMLTGRPNEHTFDNALEAALRLRNARDQAKYCNLLVAAGPPQNSCSKALLTAVKVQNNELCKVFLEARGSVNYDGGASLTAAARSENLGILKVLIEGRPSNASLVAAFDMALMSASPPPKKMKLIRTIVEAGLQGPALDTALVNAVKKGSEGTAMCELMIKHGASVNAHGGEGLDICTKSGNLILLDKLLQSSHRSSPEILSKIFQTALRIDVNVRPRVVQMILQAGMPIDHQIAAALDGLVQERRPEMQTIEVLLSFNAWVNYENHRPLVTAAKALNKPLLTILLYHSRDESAATTVFDSVMKVESLWGKGECFEILMLLLENGARGTAVDDALIKAVRDPQTGSRHLAVALLQHANIDHKDGEALQIATQKGEAFLVRRMLAMKPSSESIMMAFPYSLLSKLQEDMCLAVIAPFVELALQDMYPEFRHPEITIPPVLLCLKYYPKNVSILEATLKAGYHVDEEMPSKDDGNFTALYWTLTEGKMVGDHMVEFLISQGANLEDHSVPLLHLAIVNGRHTVVQALIKAGADVDVRDQHDVSPLNLATRKHDIPTMKVLLAAKALANDGSLHEAAQSVNVEAIQLLLTNGHDPNFPSLRFGGRPALFELCYQGPSYLLTRQMTVQQKEKISRMAIEALIKGGALTKDRLPQAQNRSLLMHAMDSASPVMMTKAFLECGQFKYINRDFNLFMDGEYTYSATKYVEKGKCRGDNSQAESLIKFLKDSKAEDRYWKIDGAQPADMINPPKNILKAEEARKEAERLKRAEEEAIRRENDKQERELKAARRKMALEQEAENAKLEIADRAFKIKQAQEAKAHAAFVAKQNDQQRLREQKSSYELRQATSMSQLRDKEDSAKHNRSMKLVGEKRMLAQSHEALSFAYNQGMASGSGNGRRALGDVSGRGNQDMGRPGQRRLGFVEEVDE